MKPLLLLSLILTLCLCTTSPLFAADEASLKPFSSAFTATVEIDAGAEKNFCDLYNDLNSRIRDGLIARPTAVKEIRRLLEEIRQLYYRQGGKDYQRSEWAFPLAGFDSRAIDKGSNHGYIAKGYDFFSGNRHGGHPSLDIFIHDRNQDMLDDRSGRPVAVLSMTGGIVVAVEKEWEEGSHLRGGRYIWVYDPTSELLIYYAHNNELFVKPGDLLKPGDRLATVGRSGYNAAKRRSPTHLHLTVLRVNNGYPLPLDVYPWLGKLITHKP